MSSAPQAEDDSQVTWEIGTDFDSLLAKIITHGATFEQATQKASRALGETRVGKHIKTNLVLLAGVMLHPDWRAGRIDTLWLERSIDAVLEFGRQASTRKSTNLVAQRSSNDSSSTSSASASSVLIQPGTTFNLSLSSPDSIPSTSDVEKHTLTVSSVAHNAFPEELSGTLQTSLSPTPLAFHLTRSTSVLGAGSASFESPNPRDPGHIPCPLTGKIVELHPALLGKGESSVKQGDTLAIISVMKMETVVSAPVSGTVERLGRGVEEGVIMAEGMLLCVLNVGGAETARSHL